jgi:hypothetical protein
VTQKPPAKPASLEETRAFAGINDFLQHGNFTPRAARMVDHASNPGVVAERIPDGLALSVLSRTVHAHLPKDHHGFHTAVAENGSGHYLVIHASDLEALRSNLQHGHRPSVEPKKPIEPLGRHPEKRGGKGQDNQR